MRFLIGLVIGVLAGASLTALCAAASNADDEIERITGTTTYEPESEDES